MTQQMAGKKGTGELMDWDETTRTYRLTTGTVIGGSDIGPGIPPAEMQGIQAEALFFADDKLAVLASDGYSGLQVWPLEQSFTAAERDEIATEIIQRWQAWAKRTTP